MATATVPLDSSPEQATRRTILAQSLLADLDCAHGLNDRYFELFALVVNGVLPEDDDHCRERKAPKKSPNLSLRLGPAQ